jgi:O-antigen ligase
MKPLLAFMAVVVLSTILQPDTHESLEGLLKLTQVCVVYVLIASIAVDRKSLKIVCIAVTATCVVASCIAVAEHFLPSLHLSVSDPRLAHATLGAVVDEDSAESGDIARVSGGVGDANYFAYTVAAAFPLTLYWWRKAGTVAMKALVLAVAMAQGIGLALSYTRTGFLGLATAAIYLALRRRLPVLPLVLLGFLALGAAAIYIPPALIERMTSTRYMEEGSTPVRRDLLYAGWHMFEQQPIFGYGYGQFGPMFVRYRRAGDTRSVIEEMIDSGYEEIHDLRCHNTYLEVAFEYGIVGLVPFMWFLARLVGDLRDAERKKPGTEDAELAIVLTAGLVAFYTCAILAHSKILNIFWILAGLAAALRRVALTQEPSAAVGSEQGIAPEIGREPERIDRIIGQPGAARIGT